MFIKTEQFHFSKVKFFNYLQLRNDKNLTQTSRRKRKGPTI